MKKLLNIAAAALASTMLFVGCSNGVAEPEKEVKVIDNKIDLEGYLTDLGWYPTFTIKGSDMLGVTEKNAKITFTYQMDEGAEYTQFGVYYDNLYDDENKQLEAWKVYDGKIYNEKGVAQTLKGDYVQISQAEPIVLYINLTEAQSKAFAKRGMVIQGENCTLTDLTITYEGEVIIERNVKDFAKATGTVGGDAKLMLDPENANKTVAGLVDVLKTSNKKLTYEFEEPVSFEDVKSLTITSKTNYTLEVKDGAVVRKSSFNGESVKVYVEASKYTYAIGDGNGNGEAGVLYKKYVQSNNWSGEPDYLENTKVKIKELWEDYTGDAEAIAFVGTNQKTHPDAKGDSCLYYVYKSNADAESDKKIYKGTEWSTDPISVTIYTDENNASTYSYEGALTGDYSDLTINISDFVKSGKDIKDPKTGKVTTPGKAVNLKKVTGIRIDTNKTEGDLYVKGLSVTLK